MGIADEKIKRIKTFYNLFYTHLNGSIFIKVNFKDVSKSKKDFGYILLKRDFSYPLRVGQSEWKCLCQTLLSFVQRVSGHETLFRRMQQVFLSFSLKSLKFNFIKIEP